MRPQNLQIYQWIVLGSVDNTERAGFRVRSRSVNEMPTRQTLAVPACARPLCCQTQVAGQGSSQQLASRSISALRRFHSLASSHDRMWSSVASTRSKEDRYSITSSASAMSDGGTSRARALAVLKLMTSSVRGGLYSHFFHLKNK